MSKSNNLPVNGQGMSETKQEKQQATNFTQISNEVLLDQRLSFKARGILALLLSRPKNWKIYIDEIVERSDADGKHSVRTGFKELKDLGYLKLVKVWNDETGKFEGTVYQLCLKPIKKSKTIVQKNLAAKNDFPTIEKTDRPKIGTSENRSDDKSDRPKTMTPSNTNSSNTKHSNTEIQQQQTTVDDNVILKNENQSNVETLQDIQTLQCNVCTRTILANDSNWKKQFVGKTIENNVILTNDKFDLLIRHFSQTSISSGTTYKNVAAIKRHFFNWFNANLKKGALSAYIEQQTVLPKKTRKQVKTLMPKTDAILNKIYGQQCENETHLYRCLQILATHSAIYENALQYLEKEEKTVVNTWLNDIKKVNNLVKRGRKAGKIDWFCAKNPKKSKPKARQNSTSSQSVNNTITGLSQRFAATQH